MQLVNSSDTVPADLELVLRELGAGDSRFTGTSFGRGECSIDEFLTECRQREVPEQTPAGMVPQSDYWMVDETGQMVGIVRVRHCLNERLLQYGGHIGYYVRPSQRGKGYAKQGLRLALDRLRQRGVSRALLTVNPENAASIRVVLSNGGVPDGQGTDPITGEVVNRYWINL